MQVVVGSSVEEDFVVELREEGLRLHFDGVLQTLRLVHARELARSPVSFSYEGRAVAGPRAPEPALAALLAAFGPSYPGLAQPGAYHLNYPGVGFVLPALLPLPLGPLEAPMQEGCLGPASELLVFRGKLLSQPQEVSLAKITHALPGCHSYLQPVLLRVARGIELPGATLLLGCSAQDVRAALGEPESVFVKTDARLKIHAEDQEGLQLSGGGGDGAGTGEEDYFFNFFSLGLDVLLDGQTHRAIKFVAHSNAPQHDSFVQYARARWSLAPEEGEAVLSVGQVLGAEARAALALPERQDPVVYSRPDGTGRSHLSTAFYGREGVIVEVLKSGQVETVQIW